MKDNRLFNRTRWRLALYYASTIGLIFAVLGCGLYRAIGQANFQAIEREISSVAGTLHDSLEIKLEQPGILTDNAKKLLPHLCELDRDNSKCLNIQSEPRHILSQINQAQNQFYYLRFYNLHQQTIAQSGIPPTGLSGPLNPNRAQLLRNDRGQNYYAIVVALHTQDHRDWGYLEVGRNLTDLDLYLQTVLWVLILGLPIALLCVGVTSWWLAGVAMQPIYQSYRQIQQFTADAAHELRTPLAATQATVESALLQPQLELQEVKDILQVILRQNTRISHLVADLLLLTRMDREGYPSTLDRCCLNDVVNDLIEEMTALAMNAQITLAAEIKGDRAIYIDGDSDRMYRLISNLIVNGIQYTLPGGKIIVRLSQDEKWASVQVEDTGIGIPLAEQGRVFDRFYRTNDDRSRHTGGSGLGLAIVKSIVEHHRGQIHLYSDGKSGTTLTVKLPRAHTIGSMYPSKL